MTTVHPYVPSRTNGVRCGVCQRFEWEHWLREKEVSPGETSDEEMMSTFYATFGVQYAREPHPRHGWVHPDGFVTVRAVDYEHAREAILFWFGQEFSNQYAEGEGDLDLDKTLFPRGELAVVEWGPYETSLTVSLDEPPG